MPLKILANSVATLSTSLYGELVKNVSINKVLITCQYFLHFGCAKERVERHCLLLTL